MEIDKLEVLREPISFLKMSNGAINTHQYTVKTKGQYYNKVFLSITFTPINGMGNTEYCWLDKPEIRVDKIQKLFKNN